MTPSRGRLVAAFAAIYLVWGSTYLFMRFAVETLPPFSVSGVRYFSAGAILWLFALWRAPAEPTAVPWRGHAVVGTLLTLGNASVAVAVQHISSGMASLLVGMTPCWMVLFEWLRHRGAPPRAGVVVGLLLGVLGTVVLVGPAWSNGNPGDLRGIGVVLLGTVAWSSGSIYSRALPRHASPIRTSGIQMIAGGIAVCAIALLLGEFQRVDLAQASFRSLASLAYLVLVGSVVGYSAYMYLLGVTTAARVSTYAFVNPIVAVLLGVLFAGETFDLRELVAGAIIVLAVAMLTLHGGERRAAVPARSRASEGLEVHEAP